MLTTEKLIQDPRRALNVGVGLSSPLWATFIAAAGAGVAYWAWAQWARGRAQHEFAGFLTGEAPAPGLTAPPAASKDTPMAEAPEPPAAPGAEPSVATAAPETFAAAAAEPVASELDGSLAVQGAPEAEPELTPTPEPASSPKALAEDAAAPAPKARAARRGAEPLIAPPHEPTVIEAAAPEPTPAPPGRTRAKALTGAAPAATERSARPRAGNGEGSKRSSPRRKG